MANDLHQAVLALQGEIGTLQKNAINPHFKSKYISLENLVEAVQPLLTKHGLTWTTFPELCNGDPALTYVLTHAETGASIHSTMPLVLDKQNAQGLGSAITYARRYALCAVLNIVADVDDDGNKAAEKKTRSTAGRPGYNDAASKPFPADDFATVTTPDDFADRMRGTKMKATDIKAWLQTEGGYDGKVVLKLSGVELATFLNSLNEAEQSKLFAWANG